MIPIQGPIHLRPIHEQGIIIIITGILTTTVIQEPTHLHMSGVQETTTVDPITMADPVLRTTAALLQAATVVVPAQAPEAGEDGNSKKHDDENKESFSCSGVGVAYLGYCSCAKF